jgi:hypothetical protein
MDFSEISGRGGVWRRAPAGNKVAVQTLQEVGPIGLPNSYFDFLQFSDGGEGNLGVEPGWFAPWASAEVMRLNSDYQVAEWLPGFFGIGSNGGGEMFAFVAVDRRLGRLLRYPSFL